MADSRTGHIKRVNEKRLVLVEACELFQRAASFRPMWHPTALTHEENRAFENLEEALKDFKETWQGVSSE